MTQLASLCSYLNQDNLQCFSSQLGQKIEVSEAAQHYFKLSALQKLDEHYNNDVRSTTLVWRLRGTQMSEFSQEKYEILQYLNKCVDESAILRFLQVQIDSIARERRQEFIYAIASVISDKATFETKFTQMYAGVFIFLCHTEYSGVRMQYFLKEMFERWFAQDYTGIIPAGMDLELIRGNYMSFVGALLSRGVVFADFLDECVERMQRCGTDAFVYYLYRISQQYPQIKHNQHFLQLRLEPTQSQLTQYRHRVIAAAIEAQTKIVQPMFIDDIILQKLASDDQSGLIVYFCQNPSFFALAVQRFYNSGADVFFSNPTIVDDIYSFLTPVFLRHQHNSQVVLQCIGNSELQLVSLLRHLCFLVLDALLDDDEMPEFVNGAIRFALNNRSFCSILSLNANPEYLKYARNEKFGYFEAPDANPTDFPNHVEVQCIKCCKAFIKRHQIDDFASIVQQLSFPALALVCDLRIDIPNARNGYWNNKCCCAALDTAGSFAEAQNILREGNFEQEGIDYCCNAKKFEQWKLDGLFDNTNAHQPELNRGPEDNRI